MFVPSEPQRMGDSQHGVHLSLDRDSNINISMLQLPQVVYYRKKKNNQYIGTYNNMDHGHPEYIFLVHIVRHTRSCDY